MKNGAARGKSSGRLLAAPLAVLAWALLGFAGTAGASHTSDVGDICYDCHTLSSTHYDPDTQLLNAASRNLPTIRNLYGNADGDPAADAPSLIPCTYCHNDPTRTTKMLGTVIDDFQSGASSHFIGKKFDGTPSTFSEYQDDYAGNVFTGGGATKKTREELQCVFCHDPGVMDDVLINADGTPGSDGIPDGYPNHPATNPNNPYRLRGVTDRTDWTPLCVGTCHASTTLDNNTPGTTADDIAVPRMGHYGWGNYNGTAIREPRGTALKTSACSSCHDAHSSGKENLISDGTAYPAGTPLASRASTLKKAPINVNNCTAFCHVGGSPTDGYETSGHGRAQNREGTQAINLACSQCHTTAVGHRDTANPKRLSSAEDITQSGMAFDGSSNGLDDDFDGLVDAFDVDTPETAWRNSGVSICTQTCHATYSSHNSGGIEGGSGKGGAGCLDCHDPHGKATGSNVEMIRANIGGEAVTYAVAPPSASPDFYRADGTGLCDNVFCHGKALGNPSTPGTILGDTAASHAGVGPGSNCGTCHFHQGQASFKPNCDRCHGYPPNSAAHTAHILEQSIPCTRCHDRLSHNDGTLVITSKAEYDALNAVTLSNRIDVVFDSLNSGASYAPAKGSRTSGNNGTCNNLYCHGAPLTAGGTDTTPVWNDPSTAECGDCHSATNPGTNSHGQHLSAQATFGIATIACATCHTAATAATHVDGTVTFTGSAAGYTGVVNDHNPAIGRGSCGTNSCHNDGKMGAPHNNGSATYIWGTAIENCRTCHGDEVTTQATEAHDAHLAGERYACTECHAAATEPTHINQMVTLVGTLSYSGDLAVSGTNFGSCGTGSCHNAAANIAWNATAADCSQCHQAAADVNNFVGDDKAASMVSAAEYTTVGHGLAGVGNPNKGCLDCHDLGVPHDTTTNLSGGTNPFRLKDLDGVGGLSFSCSYDAGCHPAGTNTDLGIGYQNIKSHSAAEMTAAGYNPKYDGLVTEGWDVFTPGCVNCHDPHGDGANISMIQKELYDKAAFELPTQTPPPSPTEQTGLVFTDNATGVASNSYSWTTTMAPNYSGICQECHEGAPGTSSTYAFVDGVSAAAANHAMATDCSACHRHDSGFKPSCSGCHGTDGSNIYPDGGAQNGTGYENRGGAHQQHVAAIVDRNAGTSAGDGSTCSWCHPGGKHSGDMSSPPADVMNGAANKFKTIAGGIDVDGAFVPGSSSCTNVDCHAGVTTPGWYTTADVTAPVWTPNSGITATNPSLGGVLNVSWNAAVDAYPSNPVTYDLYRSTTGTAAAVFAGPPILTNLMSTSIQVTGLVVGATYYFGVRAKDSWTSPNATTNNDISAGVAPSANPWAPGIKTYYLTRSSGANLWAPPATTTNLSACGTPTIDLAVASAPLWTAMPGPTTPPAGRGLLTTTKVCSPASTNNYMESNATRWSGQWRNFAGFYTAPYPGQTLVQGSSGNVGLQGYYYNDNAYDPTIYEEYALVVFAAVDSGGNTVATSTNSVQTPALSTTMASYPLPNMTPLSVTVPEGGRLAVLFYFYDHPNSGAAPHRIAYDNYDATITSQIVVNETLLDVLPPAWTGGVSGITAQDAGTGGVINVFWNSAADLPAGAPAPPVLYDLYRVQSASCTDLWNNRYQVGLASTNYQDTGLTNGATYCYGVRAKDSWVPPNVTGNTNSATATPSQGATFGCTSCHASPPVTGNNAGSHAAHANGDAEYSECDHCHPGTSSYTNGHQDGKGQLAFDGTAATAVYNGSQLSYTDNAQVVYNDSDGYGSLTGSAGDGIDDGSCARAQTSGAQCHGGGTVDPVWGGTLGGGCGDCHNSSGKQASEAPTVTMASSHVTAPGGAGTCRDCHAGHFKGVRIPLPPASWSNSNLPATNMRTQLGIAYANAGGIDLGGAGTVASIASRTSEADICWGCHDAVATPVSEWGYNTKTSPGGFPVTTFATADGNEESENHGWIYNSAYATKTSDWTQGYWMSPYDPLLKRRMASVHTASFDSSGQSASVTANVKADGTVERTTPALEHKSKIRCSYCHDVHNSVGPAGEPYIRGTWVGDPYPPELPPRNTYSYTTGISVRDGTKTPRGLVSARDKGGYFIDQNSGWPTKNAAMDSLAETAGLCTLCHGTNVDTMDYYAGSKLWLGGMTNGHSNSCLGGTGNKAKDLFTGSRYGCGMGMQGCVGAMGADCNGNYPQSLCGSGPCEAGNCVYVVNSGWYWGSAGGNPAGTFGGSGGGDYADWYGVGTIGSADVSEPAPALAHKFTCSKCHSPHASGLPALLIQNCIDPALGSMPYSGVNLIANNCHRKTSKTDGWHILAPGQ